MCFLQLAASEMFSFQQIIFLKTKEQAFATQIERHQLVATILFLKKNIPAHSVL